MDMHTQKFKARLGLFIVGGLVLFITAIFIIGKQKNLFNPVFKITTTFHNISGLQVGNNIRFSGINVGTVDNIDIINDSTVRVEMLIKKDVQRFMRSDCQIGIGSEGIIGDRLLIIGRGSKNAPLIEDGQSLFSSEPLETDALMASLMVTAKNAEVISAQLAEIMGNMNNGQGTIGRLIKDSTIAENLNQTILNLKRSSKGLDDMVINISEGKGTIGRLIQDSTIAENINLIIVNLRNSTKGMEELTAAAKHSFLFRGYFKDQKSIKIKEAEKIKADSLEQEKKKLKAELD